MGLDMFAVRQFYVKQWDCESADERYEVRVERGGKPVLSLQSNRISVVEEEVMYWRKAIHIHEWFVHNVQDGIDDCRTYEVTWENLRELLKVCEKVMKASKLVPGSVPGGMRRNLKDQTWEELREPGLVIQDATVAKKLLPTREGFFSGNTEYNAHYLQHVEATRQWAAEMLADHDAGCPGYINYSSSW